MVVVMDDDGITCNCAERKSRGWGGVLPVPVDGSSWPVEFAAKMIGCSETDLRAAIRLLEVDPVGSLKMASFRRSGRHPRAYDASKLVAMWDGLQELRLKLRGE